MNLIDAKDGRKINHLLDVDSLSLKSVHTIINSSKKAKSILLSKNKTLSLKGKTIVSIFFENSTRTRVSFEQAGKILGADVINVNVPSSSISKGESILNTVKTIQSIGMDSLIVRHNHSGVPYFIARNVNVPVINAGDGMHAHPTQSLLDLFTINTEIGDIKDKKILIIGDIKHSRVARSNINLLIRLGAKITVAAPTTLLPDSWVGINKKDFKIVSHYKKMESNLADTDLIMLLRVQKERQDQGSLHDLEEYSKLWGLTKYRYDTLSPNTFIMHPGPVNEGIEIASELLNDKNSLIDKQVENGVAVRMAVLEYCISQK
jgi:aspartate carbamoyltransferase catalytic subunit